MIAYFVCVQVERSQRYISGRALAVGHEDGLIGAHLECAATDHKHTIEAVFCAKSAFVRLIQAFVWLIANVFSGSRYRVTAVLYLMVIIVVFRRIGFQYCRQWKQNYDQLFSHYRGICKNVINSGLQSMQIVVQFINF